MRKQLGVFMLLSASIHACFYTLLWRSWYKSVEIPTPSQSNESWEWGQLVTVQGSSESYTLRMNIVFGAGIIAYFAAVILGVTSLPSVSSSLTWKEFRMIQSKLGWLCLILATVHCMANGWQKLLRFQQCFFFEGEQV